MITIAIAEDHVSLSDGLKLFLEQDPDIRVLYAVTNGLELMKRIENSLPDVVLTDISMPEMNGIDLCRAIKNKRPHTKVIALSMFDNTGALKDMLDAGADGYVLKSSPLIDLRQAVRDVYEGKSFFDEHVKFQIEQIKSFKNRKKILSRSERDILISIAKRMTSQQIATERGTAISTVNKHRKNMVQKLGLSGKGELYQYSLKQHGHSNL
ncbi:MAG: two-component system nitrate/nitrite response regulator NarL [Nonlabens sp.]|jgi:two-component system nitrate/nitrite response regulator NarL|uniref:response regulator n=1 Tax=Nonlabens sp. TaxID=1888209 RepID=UPI0039E45A30